MSAGRVPGENPVYKCADSFQKLIKLRDRPHACTLKSSSLPTRLVVLSIVEVYFLSSYERASRAHSLRQPAALGRPRTRWSHPLSPSEMSPAGDAIQAKLLGSELAPFEHMELKDTSDGCGSKFEAIIVSAKFDGVGLLDRQKKVNEIIAEEMKEVHAFSMKTWTPAQYEAKKGKQ